MFLTEERSTLGAGAPTPLARADGGGDRTISGLAAVFYDSRVPGTEYGLGPNMVERLQAGAFDRTLREHDATSIWNHNSDYVLGRKSAGTLRLKVEPRGLRLSLIHI